MIMSGAIGLIGCLAFVVVLLFWRINRYERQVLIYHNRMNKLLNAFLATMGEDEREKFLQDNRIDPEKWKEPLSL